MKSSILAVVRSAADMLFPPGCVHCGADGSMFCDDCVSESVRLEPSETCRTCALPGSRGTCESCFMDPPQLDRAVATFAYGPETRSAVGALKYRDIRSVSERLGELMAEAAPGRMLRSADFLVPVPLSKSRLRARGYNQAELLATYVATRAGVSLESGGLARTVSSQPQARSAGIDERAENVRGAFLVLPAAVELFRGRRVLLVDDVMTTGVTLNDCARALKHAGAAWVGALVLAREL